MRASGVRHFGMMRIFDGASAGAGRVRREVVSTAIASVASGAAALVALVLAILSNRKRQGQ